MPIPDVFHPLPNQDIDRLRRAIAFACFAHKDQVDKSGEPYIYHVLRVGISLLPDVDAAIAGLLHDVLEDTDTRAGDLAKVVSPAAFRAILVLTHAEGEPYESYLQRVCTNPLAMKTKIADLRDNSRPDRLDKLAPEVRDRLRTKYANALNILWLAENSKGDTHES